MRRLRKDNWGADLEASLELVEDENQRKNDGVTLEEMCDIREAKILSVNEKILRQKDHIHKVQQNIATNEGHIARWKKQNARDRNIIASSQIEEAPSDSTTI